MPGPLAGFYFTKPQATWIRMVTIAVPPYQPGEGLSLILYSLPFFPLEKVPEKNVTLYPFAETPTNIRVTKLLSYFLKDTRLQNKM